MVVSQKKPADPVSFFTLDLVLVLMFLLVLVMAEVEESKQPKKVKMRPCCSSDAVEPLQF